MKIYPFDSTINIVLYEPRIPQNTGNIARSCAAFMNNLILIKPLGFSLEDKYLKRAGLDYWENVSLSIFNSLEEYQKLLSNNQRILAFSKKGRTKLQNFHFQTGDSLLFGREDVGLDECNKSFLKELINIPMPGSSNKVIGGVRSLNLASTVAIASYQACLHTSKFTHC